MLFSVACERNKRPILSVLETWLPAEAAVLEIGSGSGQHAAFFCQQIQGLHWQPSEQAWAYNELAAQLAAMDRGSLAQGSELAAPLALDVSQPLQWPRPRFDAVFTANTCHIMAAAALPHLLAGSHRVLKPGGLLLIYGPFHDGGVHTAASNAAFDAQLRSRDASMGLRDALLLNEQAAGLGLAHLADLAMPANNRLLIFRRDA